MIILDMLSYFSAKSLIIYASIIYNNINNVVIKKV